MSKIKAVLFDWHGVLVNQPYLEWVVKVASGQRLIRELLDRAGDVDRGTISLDEFRQIVAELTGLTSEEVKTGISREVILDLELVALLGELKHLKLGVVSNVNRQFLEEIMQQFGFQRRFDLIIASSEVGALKPDREIFIAALDQLGLDASQVGFVDDTEGHVQAAERMGMRGFVYKSAQQLTEAFAAARLLPKETP